MFHNSSLSEVTSHMEIKSKALYKEDSQMMQAYIFQRLYVILIYHPMHWYLLLDIKYLNEKLNESGFPKYLRWREVSNVK